MIKVERYKATSPNTNEHEDIAKEIPPLNGQKHNSSAIIVGECGDGL